MANFANDELRIRYANMVATRLRKQLVTKDKVIFNNRYEADPVAGGLRIPVRADEEVRDYNYANGLAPSKSETKYIPVVFDKSKAINSLIPGYYAAAVPDNIVADRLNSAGYAMAKQLDKDGLELLGGLDKAVYTPTDPRNGKTAGHVDITIASEADIYGKIVDGHTYQSEKDVPEDGRYIIVDPKAKALIMKDKDNFIKKGDLSQEIVMTGAIGEINGAAVYTSNNMPTDVHAILGHPDFATRVLEWADMPHLVDLEGDSHYINTSAVKGLEVYQHAATSPEAFYLIKEGAA